MRFVFKIILNLQKIQKQRKILIFNNFTIRQNYYFKKVTRNEICFQNYIKFTKDPKQTKLLILNNFTIHQNYYFTSIDVDHSYF